MISKTTHGSNFGGLLEYLLNPEKQPEIICPYMFGDNPADLATEFNAVADLRPTTRLPVRHISLSFAPGDKIDNLKKALIVDRVMEAMGYKDCQYIAVAHHRDDPGHDLAHDHDHIHIVANAVTVYGERVSDSWDRLKIQPILREIEQEYGLQPVKNSWDVKREKAHTQYPVTDLSLLVAESLENCHDLKTWLDRLDQANIDIRFALRKDGKVTGISYLKDGEIHKGSTVGASWAVVDEKLGTNPADFPLITAANAKSQKHQVNLSPVDRQQLDHAVKMAVTALKDQPRLKTGRLDIRMEGHTLTVYRMRPHKQMFKMSKTPQGWEPVGFPNLDAKDLDLLSKISGTPKDFQVIPTPPRIEVESLPLDIVGVTSIPVERITNQTKAIPAIKPKPPHRSPISDGNPLNHIREFLAMALENEPKPTPEPSYSTEIVTEIERQQRLDPEAGEQKAQQKPTAQTSTKKRIDRDGR